MVREVTKCRVNESERWICLKRNFGVGRERERERERERGNGVWGKSSFERRGFVIFQYPQTRSCGLWLSLESEVWKTSFTLSHSGFLGLWIGLTQVKLLVPIHLWNSKVTLSHKARAKLIISMLWLLQILLHLVMTFKENYSSILLII